MGSSNPAFFRDSFYSKCNSASFFHIFRDNSFQVRKPVFGFNPFYSFVYYKNLRGFTWLFTTHVFLAPTIVFRILSYCTLYYLITHHWRFVYYSRPHLTAKSHGYYKCFDFEAELTTTFSNYHDAINCFRLTKFCNKIRTTSVHVLHLRPSSMNNLKRKRAISWIFRVLRACSFLNWFAGNVMGTLCLVKLHIFLTRQSF